MSYPKPGSLYDDSGTEPNPSSNDPNEKDLSLLSPDELYRRSRQAAVDKLSGIGSQVDAAQKGVAAVETARQGAQAQLNSRLGQVAAQRMAAGGGSGNAAAGRQSAVSGALGQAEVNQNAAAAQTAANLALGTAKTQYAEAQNTAINDQTAQQQGDQDAYQGAINIANTIGANQHMFVTDIDRQNMVTQIEKTYMSNPNPAVRAGAARAIKEILNGTHDTSNKIDL